MFLLPKRKDGDLERNYASFQEVAEDLHEAQVYDHLHIFMRAMCLERKFDILLNCVQFKRYEQGIHYTKQIADECAFQVDSYAVEAATYQTPCSQYMLHHAESYCQPIVQNLVDCMKENHKLMTRCASRFAMLKKCMMMRTPEGNSVPPGEVLHILSDDEISFMNSEDFQPLTPGSVKWPYHPTRHL